MYSNITSTTFFYKSPLGEAGSICIEGGGLEAFLSWQT